MQDFLSRVIEIQFGKPVIFREGLMFVDDTSYSLYEIRIPNDYGFTTVAYYDKTEEPYIDFVAIANDEALSVSKVLRNLYRPALVCVFVNIGRSIGYPPSFKAVEFIVG